MLDLLIPLPSLILGLSTRPSTPFLELEAGNMPLSLNFPQLDFVKPSSGFHPVTWECINKDFNSQNGSSLGNVRVHSLTLSYTPGNMRCDFWASLLARTFTSPCFGRKPKARVATTFLYKISMLYVFANNLSYLTSFARPW